MIVSLKKLPLGLAKQDPYLSEEEFPKDAPTSISALINISDQTEKFLWISSPICMPKPSCWLPIRKSPGKRWQNGSIKISCIRMYRRPKSFIFFLGMIERLLEKRRWTLGELWREKYQLKEAARKKVESIRQSVKSDVFAKTLFSTSDYELVVTPKRVFTFDPEEYPYPPNSLFDGRHKFKKHYYKVVGDMKAEGEEFQCAQLLDNHPKVKRWVRNLEGRPRYSFWLQTSSDRFYPDFVCELIDGQFLRCRIQRLRSLE